MKRVRVFILLFFLIGGLYGQGNNKGTLLPSEIRNKFRDEFIKVHLKVDEEKGLLILEKGKKAGEIDSEAIIKLLKTNNINTIKLLDVTILGDLDFRELPLRKNLGLKVFLVDKHLIFERCTFAGKIISKNAKSLRVVFRNSLTFIECKFLGDVCFESARFNDIIVESSIFQGNALFFQSQFKSENSSFLDVEFVKDLVFSLSIFEKINFIGIKCKSNAFFRHIRSKKEINFSKSTFFGEADFGVSEFSGRVIFEDADFADQLFFVKVNEKLDEMVEFNFEGANFKGRTCFRESFLKNASFRPSQNQPLIFFDDADFRKVRFKKADFTGASFNIVDFSQANFGDKKKGDSLSLKNCSYKKMIVSWEQLSKALLYNLDGGDYTNLEDNFKEMKKYDDACEVYYRMKTVERKNTKSLIGILWHYFSWLLGYFVRPLKIIMEALILVFICAFFYAGVKLNDFKFKFSDTKEESHIFIHEIPVEPKSTQRDQSTAGKKQISTKNGFRYRLWHYTRNLPVAILFSFSLLTKINIKRKYISRENRNWIKIIAYAEWCLGYLMWGVFLYSLSRRSSLLQDILSGLQIF